MNNDNNEVAVLDRRSYFDTSLAVAVLLLLVFGTLMIYSTTSYTAKIKYDKDTYFLQKQVLNIGFGLIAALFAAFVPYYKIMKMPIAPIFFWCTGIIVALSVKIPGLGMTLNGAQRWIRFGSFTIQVAEIVKICIIMAYAAFLYNNQRLVNTPTGYIICVAFLGIECGILGKATNNMSSAIIIALIGMAMIVVVCKKLKYTALLGAFGVFAGYLYLKFDGGFRGERFDAFLHPEKHMDGIEFQTQQGLYAIGSGGIFGKGYGNSIQKLGIIPEAENDMIFTIICEELGLFGAIIVVGLFVYILYKIYVIGINAPNMIDSLICVGVFTQIASQFVLNIAVVTKMIPNTGVTLPFISYGGTSVIFLLVEIGLVLNISRRIKRYRA